jgi:hypothetical protein
MKTKPMGETIVPEPGIYPLELEWISDGKSDHFDGIVSGKVGIYFKFPCCFWIILGSQNLEGARHQELVPRSHSYASKDRSCVCDRPGRTVICFP